MRRFLAAAALLLGLSASAANAAVTYTFVGTQNIDGDPVDPQDPDAGYVQIPVAISFSLTVADFLTNGVFTPDSCSTDNAALTCADMEFDNFSNQFNVGGDFLGFGTTFDDGNVSGSGTAFYFFAPGAFGAAGVYTTDNWPINGPPIASEDNGYGCCVGNAGFATLTVSGAPDVTGVPEPEAWALMILGFTGAGAALRRRRSIRFAAA
jgi:hypothetical protein